MKKIALLAASIFVLTACGSPTAQDTVSGELGVDASSAEVLSQTDDHGGFHGDGTTFVELQFSDDAVLEQIEESGDWKAFPIDRTARALVYGVTEETGTEEAGITVFQTGPYLEDGGGNRYPMAGVIRGRTYPAGKLVRFGYINLKILEENGTYLHAGEGIRGHEFHYWDSTDSGTSCTAVKPDGTRSWSCIHAKGNLFAGYPHLYLPSMPEFARRFVRQCRIWEHRGCAGNEKKAGN